MLVIKVAVPPLGHLSQKNKSRTNPWLQYDFLIGQIDYNHMQILHIVCSTTNMRGQYVAH